MATRGLINHRKLAKLCDVTTKTLRAYVERGQFPMPHSIVEPLWFYRLDVVEHFLQTGNWPDGLRFSASQRSRAKSVSAPR